jgi:hypothetical protein
MKRVVNSEQKSAISCNRYVIAKWLQGQLANLCTFVHLCFIASAVDCFRTGADTVTAELDYLRGEADHELHKVDAALNKAAGTAMAKSAVDPTAKVSKRALMVGLSAALALLAVPVFLVSHYKRVKYVWKSIKLQPTVHRLLPNAYRNSQLAWLCNLQAANVVLESISLSDYMLAYGGPVVAGKLKNLPADHEMVTVDDMKLILLGERLKYQDFPMLVILISHCITHLATLPPKSMSSASSTAAGAPADPVDLARFRDVLVIVG